MPNAQRSSCQVPNAWPSALCPSLVMPRVCLASTGEGLFPRPPFWLGSTIRSCRVSGHSSWVESGSWMEVPHPRRCHVSQMAGNLPDVGHFSERGFLPYMCSYQQGFASEIQNIIGCRMPEDPPPSAAVLYPFAPRRSTSNRLGLCSLLVFIPEIGWDFIILIPSDVQPLMFS